MDLGISTIDRNPWGWHLLTGRGLDEIDASHLTVALRIAQRIRFHAGSRWVFSIHVKWQQGGAAKANQGYASTD